ncbi:MAG TPA: hypothetical protein VNO75_09585 [Gemmatimonadaceae bacterium]|nr:hypothetical protein [Gemmatimonadaceae bacterium]
MATGCDDDDITDPFDDVDEPRLAFASNRDGDFEIYTMESDGSNVVQLTTDNSADNNPTWRGDGDFIAFTSTRTGNSDIWIMEADGSDQANVTANIGNDDHPSFSPDGDQIVFTSDRDGDFDLYIINTDGTGLRQLTDVAGIDNWPSWSPDGDEIVFSSTRAGSAGADIWIMEADGTGTPVQLTTEAGTDNQPSWSADGDKIAYSTVRAGNIEIFTMDPDGTDKVNATNSVGADTQPAYSGHTFFDVLSIFAWTSTRDAVTGEIYVMDDTGASIRLTNNTFTDENPSFK